jgi:Rrf2 family protein
VEDISERQELSPRYLERILLTLKEGGIVKSVRGFGGGYFLAGKPEKITVGDIIRAIDGKSIQPAVGKGSEQRRKPSDHLEKCVVSEIWDEASKRLMDYFDSVTLNQLCEEAGKKEAGI